MAQVNGGSVERPDDAVDQINRKIPFKFTGRAGEYFGIWISNIFLTVATLGIYSAWAKVRNLRYFYRSTSLDGAHFDYHADPLAILKGRIIAVAFFAVYLVLSELLPLVGLGLSLVLIGAIPWIIVRSLKFRFAYTSYRNLRFGFYGTYRGAMKEYILMPILLIPTLGLLWPYIRYRQQRYIVSNLKYGTSPCRFEGPWLPWFFAGLPLVLVSLLGFVGPAIYIAITLRAALDSGEAEEIDGEIVMNPDSMESDPTAAMVPIIALAFLAFYIAIPYYIVRTRNLLFEASSVSTHRFESTMKALQYAGVVILSLLIVAFTLGFGIPIAKVIMAKYKAETLSLLCDGDLNAFIAQETENVQALGEELGDAFDIDIDI